MLGSGGVVQSNNDVTILLIKAIRGDVCRWRGLLTIHSEWLYSSLTTAPVSALVNEQDGV